MGIEVCRDDFVKGDRFGSTRDSTPTVGSFRRTRQRAGGEGGYESFSSARSVPSSRTTCSHAAAFPRSASKELRTIGRLSSIGPETWAGSGSGGGRTRSSRSWSRSVPPHVGTEIRSSGCRSLEWATGAEARTSTVGSSRSSRIPKDALVVAYAETEWLGPHGVSLRDLLDPPRDASWRLRSDLMTMNDFPSAMSRAPFVWSYYDERCGWTSSMGLSASAVAGVP